MAQPKGHTGNPNGRPKGALNKTTTTVRSWLLKLINDNRELIEQDFKTLEPKDRLTMLEKLLPYLMPKVNNDAAVEGACYTIEDVEPAKPKPPYYDLDEQTPATVKHWYEKEPAAAAV